MWVSNALPTPRLRHSEAIANRRIQARSPLTVLTIVATICEPTSATSAG
jgi:hypothetical protein